MRFTKVPLIATLVAGALSLLVILPALAQNNDTRGEVGDDKFQVAVLKSSTPASGPAPAYAGGVLYVSNDGDEGAANDPDVANWVRVSVVVEATDLKDRDPDEADVENCVEITAKNIRSGQSVKAYAGNEAFTGAPYPATAEPAMIKIIPYGEPNVGATRCTDEATRAAAQLSARDGDVIRITASGSISSQDMVVDGKGPVFTDVAPAHKSYSRSNSARFQFTVTDAGSGLRHDGEFVRTRGDLDVENVDEDADGERGSEPRSTSTGAAADIQLEVPVGTDNTAAGTSRWRRVGDAVGRSYSLDVSLSIAAEASTNWRLTARDRVGNQTVSDADSSEDGKQPYKITVDTLKPQFGEARTGISYSASKKEEVRDRSAIAVTIRNGDSGGADDELSAVDHTDFRVEGHAVTGVIHATTKSTCTTATTETAKVPDDIQGECIDNPKARIYLQLADDLAPNEKPEIEMLGGAVIDLAGNANDPGKIDARDTIPPALTVEINPGSDASGRPVIRKTGEVTVRVSSDEELRRRPSIYFAAIKNIGTTELADLRIREASSGGSIAEQSGADNTWQRVYRANSSGLSGKDGLVVLIVTGDDADGNRGVTDGVDLGDNNEPSVDDKLKLQSLIDGALLIEVDGSIDSDPDFSLAPYRADDERSKTESSRPFITIEFAEAKEAGYNVGGVTVATSGNPSRPLVGDELPVTEVILERDGEKIKLDSHTGVTITSATLDGESVSDSVRLISAGKYTITTSGLSVGKHTLRITAVDDAGNSVTDSYPFEVVGRSKYQVKLTPGWNLVSLPSTPVDAGIDSVMSGLQAQTVLSFRDGEWVTAVYFPEDGEWRGTLTEIVGGYGYWISTSAFETLATLITDTDTSSVLPTAAVTAGWNLLGVVDVEQAKAGDPPAGGGDADDYFSNLQWSVAYSYSTLSNDWTRIRRGGAENDEAITNGAGYWVWATAPGTLVP